MTLQPIKDISEYKRLKETLRDRFESEKTGDQTLFEEQTKKYKPLLTSQQEISKTMQEVANQIVESQNESKAPLLAIAPALQNLQRTVTQAAGQPQATDIFETPRALSSASSLPSLSSSHIPLSTRKTVLQVNLDQSFDQTEKDNLKAMNLPLPSEVYTSGKISETFDTIKTLNRSHGQKLGIGPASKTTTTDNKKELESQKETLKKYKEVLLSIESSKKLLPHTKKTGKGVLSKTIYYSSVDDLCNRLALLCAAKDAGNNGVDNDINSILDELLRTNAIDKDAYNTLYKSIF